MYEVIYFKVSQNRFTWRYYHILKGPKTSDVIEMVGITIVQFLIRYLWLSESLHLLWQSRHSFNTVIPSSADLTCFCNIKYLIAPTFETSVQQIFKGFLWFFELSHNMFYLSSSRIRNKIFKNCIHFLLIFWI